MANVRFRKENIKLKSQGRSSSKKWGGITLKMELLVNKIPLPEMIVLINIYGIDRLQAPLSPSECLPLSIGKFQDLPFASHRPSR
jgi:hypothetical protein